jgi:ATP-dependent DNA helicase RecG
MSLEIKEVTDEQRERILRLQEGHFYDLKSKLVKPGKLGKHISGFANADGGELYIGIHEENKHLVNY